MIRRTIRGTGKALISAGVLILMFVGYQLWGTALTHGREQKSLRADFAGLLAAPPAAADTVPTAGASPATTVAAPVAPPEPIATGSAAALIEIPRIGLDQVVVEGVGVEDLKKGVGHYPETRMPGEKGNAALAGHRTTYGAPFNRIDELQTGDPILVTTTTGSFRYEVMEKMVVTPEDVWVLDPTEDSRITLTTCHPKYSAAQRLIVIGRLVTPPVEPAPAAEPPVARTPQLVADDETAGLSGAGAANRPAIAWGIMAAAVWLGAWAIGRWTGRKWASYFLSAPLFLVVLYMFFENFARLLPANV